MKGIYKIVNTANGKYYVGSSNDVCGRWQEHTNDLLANRHVNVYLQRSWNKYGQRAFDFVFLENVNLNDLLIREQQYLDLALKERDKCYNLKFVAGSGGGFTAETIQKIREAKLGPKNPNYGKHPSKLTLEKLSKAHVAHRNGRYDHAIYVFVNMDTSETFRGTRYEFVSKYGIKRELVRDLVKGRQKKTHGWKLQ